jgi:hypothetical protein
VSLIRLPREYGGQSISNAKKGQYTDFFKKDKLILIIGKW